MKSRTVETEISKIKIVSSVQSLKILKMNLMIQKKVNRIMKMRTILMTQMPVKTSVKKDWIGTRWRRRPKGRIGKNLKDKWRRKSNVKSLRSKRDDRLCPSINNFKINML